MRKWIDKETFDELLLKDAENAVKEIEWRIKDYGDSLESLHKFVPDAGYYYYVSHNEETYENSFLGMYIGFRRNGILFLVQKIIYPKRYYKLFYDDCAFVYSDSYSERLAYKELTEPNRMGVFSKKKIDEWVNYRTQGYRNLERINQKNERKITSFRKRLEALPDVRWDNSKIGTITRRGLKYRFEIHRTDFSEEISLLHSLKSLDQFLALSDNKYEPTKE